LTASWEALVVDAFGSLRLRTEDERSAAATGRFEAEPLEGEIEVSDSLPVLGMAVIHAFVQELVERGLQPIDGRHRGVNGTLDLRWASR